MIVCPVWFVSLASMSRYEAVSVCRLAIVPVSFASRRVSSVPCGYVIGVSAVPMGI
jgi:hypothetical protein